MYCCYLTNDDIELVEDGIFPLIAAVIGPKFNPLLNMPLLYKLDVVSRVDLFFV